MIQINFPILGICKIFNLKLFFGKDENKKREKGCRIHQMFGGTLQLVPIQTY